MNNKYRGANVEFVAPPSRDPEIVSGTFEGGMILAKGAQQIELNQSPKHDKVRVEFGALRADYSVLQLGDATAVAGQKIYALGEHRFVVAQTTLYEKIFRLYHDNADPDLAVIDSLDDSDPDPANWEWVNEVSGGGTDSVVISDTLLSWESFFNQVFFADGTAQGIFRWDRSTLIPDEGNDFPTTNLLVAEGESVDVTVTPAGALLYTYVVHCSLVVTGPSEEGGYVTISVEHMGLELFSVMKWIAQSSDTDRVSTFANIPITVVRNIADGDPVSLKIKTIYAPSVTRLQTLTRVSTTNVWEATPKTPLREAYLKTYTFKFHIGGTGTGLKIDIYFDYDGVGYLLAHTASTYNCGVAYVEDLIADEDVADVVGFKIVIDETPSSHTFAWSYVEWEEKFEVAVHGFNKVTDSDANYGIEYSLVGVEQNDLLFVRDTIEPTDPVVRGRYLGVIADRLVVLQSDGDPQRVRWSVNGDPLDWIGNGSGDTALSPIISRSDPIDPVMALKSLASDVGVLFRQRSIMRVVPTGLVNPALAFYPWIEKLGTESPFSVVTTPYGIIFLGHDRQIYLLTESGHQAIGSPINEKFAIDTPADVEAVYDPVTQEYILSIPEDH
jgi:hypothetical protein